MDSQNRFNDWAVGKSAHLNYHITRHCHIELSARTAASGITTGEVDPYAGLSDLSNKGTLYGRDAGGGFIVSWDVNLDAEHSTAVRS